MSVNAAPGAMWPGSIWPGEPLSGAAPPPSDMWRFTEGYTCIYQDYLDAVTMKTLVAQPGGTYQITPVGGDPGIPAIPGDGRWTSA